MKLEEFLNKIDEIEKINIIGPMVDRKNIPKISGPIIFVDGGKKFDKYFPKEDICGESRPTFSLGDGDSYEGDLDLTIEKEKDFSDLNYAFRIIPTHIKEIHLIGFLGGRKDHELINLGECHQFLIKNSDTKVIFDLSEIESFSPGDIKVNIEGIFSILSLTENNLGISGNCKYHLSYPSKVSPFSSHCLSNIGSGNIHIQSDRPIFLIKVKTK